MATVLTLLVKIEVLADMVSIGSLFAMLMVCACVLTTRYQQPNGSITPGIPHHPRLPPLTRAGL